MEIIKKDRISYSIGSFNWFSHYSVAIMLIVFGLLNLTLFKGITKQNELFLEYLKLSTPLILGVILFFIQKKKLEFKTLGTSKSQEQIQTSIKAILRENDWVIKRDSNEFIYAIKSSVSKAALSFNIENNKIKYNLNARESVQPIDALISRNDEGQKLIELIKKCT